jgi:hypothetical protein
MRPFALATAFFICLLLSTQSHAAYHWVSSSGSAAWGVCIGDTDPGIYCSLSTANSNITAGQTVYLKAGTYTTAYIKPTNSGSSGNPITYKNYGGTVTISSQTYAVYLSGKNYIAIDGINGDSCTQLVHLSGASYNEIKNGTFNRNTASNWEHSILYNSSRYNWIHSNTFSRAGQCSGSQDYGAVFDIGNEESSTDDSSHNLVEDNTIFYGGHHALQVSSKYNTIRRNYVHNEAWTNDAGHRSGYMQGRTGNAGYCLFEDNRFSYTDESCSSNGPSMCPICTPSNIFRYNVLNHAFGKGIGIYSYAGSGDYTVPNNNRIYNNTFFANNYDNIGETAVSFDYSTTGNRLNNNLYYLNAPKSGSYSNVTFTKEYNGDSVGNPLFVNAAKTRPTDKTDRTTPDLHLQSGSPAINYGGALTTVASGGTGVSSITLSDATYFQDGTWAPSGKVFADWIAVGTVTNVVQISSISGNVVNLASPITCSTGQAVWLYKKSDGARVLFGSAPDAGAHEVNPDTPPDKPNNLRVVSTSSF